MGVNSEFHFNLKSTDLCESDYQALSKYITAKVYFNSRQDRSFLDFCFSETLKVLMYGFYASPRKNYGYLDFSLGFIRKSLENPKTTKKQKLSFYIPCVTIDMIKKGSLGLFIEETSEEIHLGISEVNKATNPEERWEEYIKGVGLRFAPDKTPDIQNQISKLFRDTRNANGVFSTLFEKKKLIIIGQDVRAVFITTGISLDGDGLKISSGILFTFTNTGYMREYRPPARDIYLDPDGETIIISITDWSEDYIKPIVPKQQNQTMTVLVKLMPMVQISPYILKLDLNIKEAFKFYNIPITQTGHVNGFATALRRGRARYITPLAGWAISQCMKNEFTSEFRRLMSVNDIQEYNWFCQGNTVWRRQAIQAYPAFSRLIVNSNTFTNAIDNGEQILPLIQSKTGLNRSVIKKLQKQNWQRLGANSYRALNSKEELRDCFDAINNSHCSDYPKELVGKILNNSHVPNTRLEWKSWFMWLSSVVNMTITTENIVDWTSLITENSSRFGKNWTLYREDIYRADDRIDDFINNVNNVFSHLFQPHEDAIKVALKQEGLELSDFYVASCVSFIVTGKIPSLKSLRRQSAEWHRRANWLSERMTAIRRLGEEAQSENPSWYTPMPNVENPDGSYIRWLTTDSALQEETKEMNHCVWTYGDSCYYGGSHILALCSPQGERSTAQLVFDQHENDLQKKIILIQHQGPENHKPAENCHKMLTQYIDDIKEVVDYAKAEEELKIQQAKSQHVGRYRVRRRDFNNHNIQQCNAIWETYQIFLDGPFKYLSFQEAKEMLTQDILAYARTRS